MQAIRMAHLILHLTFVTFVTFVTRDPHLMPSRHRRLTSVSSLSWRPTLKAASSGVQDSLNMGLTCSWSVAVVKFSFTCDADSIKLLAVCEMLSSSMFHSSCFFLLSSNLASFPAAAVLLSFSPHFILIADPEISS